MDMSVWHLGAWLLIRDFFSGRDWIVLLYKYLWLLRAEHSGLILFSTDQKPRYQLLLVSFCLLSNTTLNFQPLHIP